jgi:hypothetical protein
MDQWLIGLDPGIKAAFDAAYDSEETAKKVDPAQAANMQREQDKLVQQAKQMAQDKAAADASKQNDQSKTHMEPAGKGKPPVVVIDKPVNVNIDKEQARRDQQNVQDSENLIRGNAERMVSRTHFLMRTQLVTWFQRTGPDMIGKMPDGPADLTTGLVTALVGGITSVLGKAYPEAAAALAALSSLESGPAGSESPKAQAAKLMSRMAAEAEKKVDIGRDNAVKAIPAMVQKLEDANYDKFADRTDQNVEDFSQQVASHWGTFADPGILSKLETRLQKILMLRLKQEELNGKVKSGKLSRGAADQQLKQSEKDFDQAHPGGEPKQAPHVTVVDDPIVVHGKDDPLVSDPGVRLKMDLERVRNTETQVANRAETKVRGTHQDMHDAIDKWFRHDSHETIDTMSDGPGDLAGGLVTALVGGITGVIGAAFPEAAVAMAVVNALEQGVQTGVVTQKKDDAADLKDRAKGLMIKIADKADDAVYQGRDNAIKAIPKVIQKLKETAYDRFVAQKPDVETLANDVASHWGTYADPNILNKLDAKLHKTLVMWIKREELYLKLTKGKISRGDAEKEMDDYDKQYNREHGVPEPSPYTVDTTRPN